MAKINELVHLLNKEGCDFRIPFPDQRPLVVLAYRAYENPNPKVMRFKTLAEAAQELEQMWREAVAINGTV